MDAIELLRSRASNAKLQEPAPEGDVLESILEAALRAPDHGLLRPWRIGLLRGPARTRIRGTQKYSGTCLYTIKEAVAILISSTITYNSPSIYILNGY